MAITKSDILVLGSLMSGEVSYSLESVLKYSKAGPIAEFNLDEINDDMLPEHSVSFKTKDVFIDNGIIVFYKQHGKYTIILGKETAKAAMVKGTFNGLLVGRLITSVTLKKAKIT